MGRIFKGIRWKDWDRVYKNGRQAFIITSQEFTTIKRSDCHKWTRQIEVNIENKDGKKFRLGREKRDNWFNGNKNAKSNINEMTTTIEKILYHSWLDGYGEMCAEIWQEAVPECPSKMETNIRKKRTEEEEEEEKRRKKSVVIQELSFVPTHNFGFTRTKWKHK